MLHIVQEASEDDEDDDYPDDDLSKAENKQSEPREKLKGKFSIIIFKNPAFREFLQAKSSPQTKPNGLLPDVVEAKVQVFTVLCNIIADRQPLYEKVRLVLQGYAVSKFVDHLLDIEHDSVSEKQCTAVVEGLARILTNENATSKIFEDVTTSSAEWATPFDLYDSFSFGSHTVYGRTTRPIALRKVIERWARKMDYIESEDISTQARDWFKSTNKNPQKMLESLAVGHLRSWFSQVTVEGALVPYKLAYRALIQVRLLCTHMYEC